MFYIASASNICPNCIKLKKTIISLGVFKHSGGPTKTIAAFQNALSANLYSFCDPLELRRNPLAINAEPIIPVSIPGFKQIHYSTSRATKKAENSFAESRIVSCHSFYRYHAVWVEKMSRKHAVPYWFVPHGILDPWVMQSGRFAKKIYWAYGGARFLEQASTVIFSTSLERDKAMSQFELPGAEVIPWPVDLVDCSNEQARRGRIRAELGISDDARVLLYFGRLHSMKQPLETIRSVAKAGDESLHLLMVGNEQDVSLKDCYAVADECGIAARVHLIGPVYGEAKFDYMMAADAYISLSHRENFNHTAAESLSAGLPVILSQGNDLQGDINEAKCSWGVSNDELKSAIHAIEAFSQTSFQELEQMGTRGRAWVSKYLQFSTFRERINAVAKKYGR